MPIIVRGDGAVIFNFPASEHFFGPPVPGFKPRSGEKTPSDVIIAEQQRTRVQYARLEYMNAWLVGYMSGLTAILRLSSTAPSPLDPFDHLRADLQGKTWYIYNKRHEIIVGDAISSPITPDILDYACRTMNISEQVFGANFADPLACLMQSAHQYRIHQFPSAHLIAWALSEQVLNAMWKDYLQEASEGQDACTNISKKRHKLLTGRDYTASIITQVLSLAGRLSDDRLAKLDQARRDRNNFAHSLIPVSADAAQNALTLAAEMLSDLLKIEVSVHLSYMTWL